MEIQQATQGGGPDIPPQIRRDAGAQARGHRNRNELSKNGMEGRLARGLGWFSIGLGLAEVAAARHLARLIGVRDDHGLLPLLGLREIASGVGILMRRRPTGSLAAWQWLRIGGDMMDLALLGAALKSRKANRGRVVAATAAVAGVTALDIFCCQRLSNNPHATTRGRSNERGSGIRVVKSITVNRSPEEVYRFWRNFQNLPRFMYHLKSVQVADEKRSHWVAKAPAGTRVEWDAEIVDDRPNELIAWRSLEGSDVDNSGSVRFEPAPGGRGTIVRVEMQYNPPGGLIGAGLARLFGEEPEQQVKEDLRRFKQMIEVGEIVTTEGQPAGRPSSTSWKYDRTVRSRDAAQQPLKGRGAASS